MDFPPISGDINIGATRTHWLGMLTDLLTMTIWVWLKIKQEGLLRFWSMFPLTRVPFRVPVF